MYRTNNGGQTWTHNTDTLPASGVNAIAPSPTNFDSILINVQTGEGRITFGIYRSTNGGNSFTPTGFVPSAIGKGGLGSHFKINIIRYHPRIPNLVFIGTSEGLYVSRNNLASWSIVTNTSWDIKDVEFHRTKDSIIYVQETGVNKNALLKSTDTGKTFSVAGSMANNNTNFVNISLSSACDSCVYWMSDAGVFKSVNEGATFSAVIAPPPSGVSCWMGCINDQDTTKIVSGYLDMFRSSNGGQSFTKSSWWDVSPGNGNGSSSKHQNFVNSTHYTHADMMYITCVNGIYYACTDGFLCKSTDNGQTWIKLNLKAGIRENYAVGVCQSNNDIMICGSQDNGTSLKKENEWWEIAGADGMECFFHPLNDKIITFSTQSGGRGRFNDGGEYETTYNHPPTYSGGAWEAPMFYDPNNHFSFVTLGNKAYRSNDLGLSWESFGATNIFTTGELAWKGAIAENNTKIMAASSYELLSLTKDGGTTWTNIKNNIPGAGWFSDICFDPKRDSTIIVTLGDVGSSLGQNKVFMTTNLGASWTNITYNLGYMPIRSVVIDHSDSSYIYVGAEIGIYRKSKNSTTWTLYNENLPNVCVKDLEINYGANTIKAATWGRGLWEYSLYGRNSYPAIIKTAITHPPTLTQPVTGISQYVTSTIDYSGTLSSVFVRWSKDTANFTAANSIPMTLTSGVWKSNTPLPDDTAGKKIYFKVYAVGSSNDTTETYKFMYQLKPLQPYCAAGGSGGGTEFISRFKFANIDKTSTSTNSQYANYDSLYIRVKRDSTYILSTYFNWFWNGSSDHYIWIDYDNDHVFAANEMVSNRPDYTFSSGGGTGKFINDTITIPSTATLDTLRLRIRHGYWNPSGDPCGTMLGEVEDYSVIVGPSKTTTYSSLSPNVCNSYTSPSGKVKTVSTIFNDTIPNAAGGDSVITVNLTIKLKTTSSISPGVCNQYTSPSGKIKTNSGVFNDTIPNAAGCDSIITVNLLIKSTTSSSISPSVCSQYTSPSGKVKTSSEVFNDSIPNAAGCDSIITVNLTRKSNTTSSISPSACNQYTSPSGKIKTTSGVFNDTIPNAAGCDSIITVNLLIKSTTSSSISPSVCSQYTSPSGKVKTSSEVFNDTIPNAAGCDSNISINLTIQQILTNTIYRNICANQSYFWNGINRNVSGTYLDTFTTLLGCDSIVSLILSVMPTKSSFAFQSICQGDSILFNSNYIKTGGSYNDTFITSSGCDSIFTLHLSIRPLPFISIVQNGKQLIATSGYSKYVWKLGSLIFNDSLNIITPPSSGLYTVNIIDNDHCKNSAVFSYINSAINNANGDGILLYPNPTANIFYLKFDSNLKLNYSIFNVEGRVVLTGKISNQESIDVSKLVKGEYIIIIENNKLKFIKN